MIQTYPDASMGNISSVHSASVPRRLSKSFSATRDCMIDRVGGNERENEREKERERCKKRGRERGKEMRKR